MICGWHISSSVSALSTSATGSARNDPQVAMSVSVLAMPPAGASDAMSSTGSTIGTSENGAT